MGGWRGGAPDWRRHFAYRRQSIFRTTSTSVSVIPYWGPSFIKTVAYAHGRSGSS
jgi:hypothetical protein